jgi:hypothetical protein
MGESVIIQENKSLAFYSRKLSDTQQRYSFTKAELLSITTTLQEFNGMLWVQQVKVFTYLMRDTNGDYPLKKMDLLKGIHNTVADAVSWLDYTPMDYNKPLSVVCANCSEKEEISFPPTVNTIAAAQKAD